VPDKIYVKLRIKKEESGEIIEELYSSNLPTVTIHNLLLGKMYSEVSGSIKITNHSTN
jgi:hypothetical protein